MKVVGLPLSPFYFWGVGIAGAVKVKVKVKVKVRGRGIARLLEASREEVTLK
jgi:hypothetical protein